MKGRRTALSEIFRADLSSLKTKASITIIEFGPTTSLVLSRNLTWASPTAPVII